MATHADRDLCSGMPLRFSFRKFEWVVIPTKSAALQWKTKG